MRGLNSFGLKEASALEARGGGSSSASPGGASFINMLQPGCARPACGPPLE